MKYYKIKWNDTRGDEYDNWGKSNWYLELDYENYPMRQIEVYDNGKRLKYHSEMNNDAFGKLGDQPIEINEVNGIELSLSEFERQWKIKSFNQY